MEKGQFSEGLSAKSHQVATFLEGEGTHPFALRRKLGSTARLLSVATSLGVSSYLDEPCTLRFAHSVSACHCELDEAGWRRKKTPEDAESPRVRQGPENLGPQERWGIPKEKDASCTAASSGQNSFPC